MPHQGDIKTHPPQSEPTVLPSQEPQGWASHGHLLLLPFPFLSPTVHHLLFFFFFFFSVFSLLICFLILFCLLLSMFFYLTSHC